MVRGLNLADPSRLLDYSIINVGSQTCDWLIDGYRIMLYVPHFDGAIWYMRWPCFKRMMLTLQYLRSVLNASARLIYASRRTEHVTPLLRDLHWLRYLDRIDYKLAVLVYRCLHGLAPGYLTDEFTRVSEIVSRRNLRSASTANLVVPRFQRKTLGGRAFPVAAAQAWNSLPSHVTSSSSLASFKRSLKTELFLRLYVEAWYRLMLHVTFLTLLRALEVNIDLRHVNHIRYYYYYYYYLDITSPNCLSHYNYHVLISCLHMALPALILLSRYKFSLNQSHLQNGYIVL